MTAARQSNRLAVALLILLPALFFADVLLGVANFCMRDLARFYYPTKQIYREIVADGEFPFWNRYFHAGQPLAANPEHEIFYPFTWLLMLPDYDFGYRMHILVHLVIGLLGMYALLRSMELGNRASFFGAVSWGFGGLYLSYVNLLPILFSAAWLPLSCLYARRFLRAPNARDFALASLFLGLQCLVAEPTTILQSGFLIGMYGLYRAWYTPSGRRLAAAATNTARVGLMSLAAFAAGAVQILAAIDHAGDSVRSRPFAFDLVASWSMPWARLVEIIYPHVMGHVGLEMDYWGGGLYAGRHLPFLFSIYPGLAVAAFAAAAVAVKARGGRFVLILMSLSVVIAAGANTALLRFLYDIGVAQAVRYPEKFILIAIFALTVFGAKIVNRALEGDETIRRAAAGFALATTVVAAAVMLAGLMAPAVDIWLRTFGLPRNEYTVALAEMAWRDWAAASLRGLVLFALIVSMRTTFARTWSAAAMIFLLVDLGMVVHSINPRLPASFFTPAPVGKTLPPNRADYRVFHEVDTVGGPEAQAYFSAGLPGFYVLRNGLFPMITVASRIQTVLERDYDQTALLASTDFTTAMFQVRQAGRPDWLRPFLSMSNAWFRAEYRDFSEEKRRIHGDYTRVQPVEFVEGAHHPRYYIASEIVTVADRDDFVRELITRNHSDRVAFVHEPSFVPAAGEVIAVEESANRGVVDVIAHGRTLLVMSVTPHKYWRLTIDGEPAEAIVVNIGYQGVEIPGGRHRVVMQYRNDVIIAGGIISAVAIAILLLIAVTGRRARPV